MRCSTGLGPGPVEHRIRPAFAGELLPGLNVTCYADTRQRDAARHREATTAAVSELVNRIRRLGLEQGGSELFSMGLEML